MRPENRFKKWINRQSGEWLLFEPLLYRKNSNVYPETMGEIVLKANKKMINEGYYRNPDLTIDKFSEIMNINRSYLSRAINRIYGINFSTWVNLFRIEEAKRLLQDGLFFYTDMNDLADRCGYNSARSFRRVFVEKEGCTPLQYYQNVKKTASK